MLSEPNDILSKCDKIDAFLVKLDARLAAVRAACGACFDIQSTRFSILSTGATIRREYTKASEEILACKGELTKQRERAYRMMEKAAFLPKWRQAHADVLTYTDHQVMVEIMDIHVITQHPSMGDRTEVNVRVTALDQSKILWPCNSRIWGYDANSPNSGGSFPIGASLKDDLANEFPLSRFQPEYYARSQGLRTGDNEDFTVTFKEYPVNRATSVTLRFMSGVFGQDRSIEMTLPMRVFLKTRGNLGP